MAQLSKAASDRLAQGYAYLESLNSKSNARASSNTSVGSAKMSQAAADRVAQGLAYFNSVHSGPVPVDRPRVLTDVDNYIYLYHVDKYLIIPTYPIQIQDQTAVTFSPTPIMGRTAPIFSYSYSGPRTMQITLQLHRELMYDVNWGVSNFEVGGRKLSPDGGDDYVDLLIKYIQAAALPEYNAGAKLVDPPMIAMRWGRDIFLKGVVTSGVGVDYGLPIIEDGRYAQVTISFSVSEVEPYDAKTVMEIGSYRESKSAKDSLNYTLERNIIATQDTGAYYPNSVQNYINSDSNVSSPGSTPNQELLNKVNGGVPYVDAWGNITYKFSVWKDGENYTVTKTSDGRIIDISNNTSWINYVKNNERVNSMPENIANANVPYKPGSSYTWSDLYKQLMYGNGQSTRFYDQGLGEWGEMTTDQLLTLYYEERSQIIVTDVPSGDVNALAFFD